MYNVNVITNYSNYKKARKLISSLPKYPPITLVITNEVNEVKVEVNLYKRLSIRNTKKLISTYYKISKNVTLNYK